ncbi:hypothetical protein AVEN_47249-1 [Araneus ventricosus]|uniref:Uncharacterized protein n=1 Tax=Araneus ventricosus TaxID=182803 RepID=A0A4Y2RXL5_ARAVE|nr:hypothetical protein AVEN_47249-1 [Araneus ventricosus]
MHVDENGDVEGNYTVLALQNAPQNITLKGLGGEKNLSHLMLPMARFQYDGDTGEPVRSRGMFTLLSKSMFVNSEDFYHFIFLRKLDIYDHSTSLKFGHTAPKPVANAKVR